MPKREPTISFICPAYKKPEAIVRKCLKSLFEQSVKDIQVIVVFDGPDEEMRKVVSEFPKVEQYVIEHGGAPRARNFGLSKAKGKYVWMWDIDCYIKPDHAKRMLDEFGATDADFVYSGFDMAEGGGSMESESFDRYSLECGNFISSMAPIKREKAFKWDETLEAGQDWDYWLTATENGLKGVFVEGSGFVTDAYKTGLSSDKWSAENRENTIRTIRRKHGIPDREIGVYSASYRLRGIQIARILEADVIKPTGLTPTVYKTIFNLGYSLMSRFEGISDDVIKIQYWLPGEIEGLRDAKYSTVMETVKVSKKAINLVGTQYEKNKLADLAIETRVLPLPLLPEEIEKVSHELPKEFSILMATDEAYAKLLKEVAIDLPHIKFGYNSGKVSDYSCFMSFYQFAALDAAMLSALVNGRHVISNVQAEYTGFIDPDQSWEKFKADLYERIREVSKLPFNQEAQDHYLEVAGPAGFRSEILSMTKTVLEVINA